MVYYNMVKPFSFNRIRFSSLSYRERFLRMVAPSIILGGVVVRGLINRVSRSIS